MKKMILFMAVLSLLSGCAAGQGPVQGEKGSTSGTEAAAQEVPLLTEAPVFTLTDEASAENILEIGPASYSWDFEDGSEMGSVIACGVSALDAAESGTISKLKVQDGMAHYSFSAQVAPDVLRIRQWDKSGKGIEEDVRAYHDEMPLLDLEAGKIYGFELEWKEENFAKNRFYGTADYFLEAE